MADRAGDFSLENLQRAFLQNPPDCESYPDSLPTGPEEPSAPEAFAFQETQKEREAKRSKSWLSKLFLTR